MRKEIRPENYIKNNFLKHQTTTSPGINYTSSVRVQFPSRAVFNLWSKSEGNLVSTPPRVWY